MADLARATMGVAGGAALGATQIDADSAPVFYVAPTAGLAIGLGAGLIYAFTADDTDEEQLAVTGAASDKPIIFILGGAF